MAELGYRHFNEMIGQMQMFDQRKLLDHCQGARASTSPSCSPSRTCRPSVAIFNSETQDHKIHDIIDRKLIAQSQAAIERGTPVQHRAADPQYRPHRRRHAVRRHRQALRSCRPAGTIPSPCGSQAPRGRASARSSPTA